MKAELNKIETKKAMLSVVSLCSMLNVALSPLKYAHIYKFTQILILHHYKCAND